MLVSQIECGAARLGEVNSFATWKFGAGDCLEIRFDPLRLSPEQQDELCRYRNLSRPISVQLPRYQTPRQAAIIGFDRADGTFFVAMMN
jgi:hypothetical protein